MLYMGEIKTEQESDNEANQIEKNQEEAELDLNEPGFDKSVGFPEDLNLRKLLGCGG